MPLKRIPAEDADVSPLGQPLEFAFSGRTAKNRFLKGAMTERMSSWDPKVLESRGVPSKELVNVYKRWGEGGFGVILSGNIMIQYDHLEAAGNPIVPPDAPFSGPRFDAFRAMATEAKKHGSLLVAQISHPGRQVATSIQENPISASDVQLQMTRGFMRFAKPRPMEKADFDTVINGFAHAADYLHRAGYDGVQLHSAHGYLLAQFLSPTTNKRTDEYGGPLLNRARLIFQIAEAIRARVQDPSFVMSIKINSVEFQDHGFSTEDCRDLCAELEKAGFDFVELSGGTYESMAFYHRQESTRKRESFFLEFADIIAPQLKKTKVYVTGGLRTARGMLKALDTVDGVGLARPVCHEFDLPQKILDGKASSAPAVLIADSDSALATLAAGSQILLVGKDKAPLDLTSADHLEQFNSCRGKWSENMKLNIDNSMYGFVEIDGPQVQPYEAEYSPRL